MTIDNSSLDLPIDGRKDEWILLINEWRESGQTIKEWVDQKEGISYRQFLSWRERLFPEEIEKKPIETSKTWSSLNVEMPSSSLNIYIRDCRIEVTSGFDQELFREVVEVLQNAD